MGKVTNKDIAERAGVSAAAVSLAIHGRKGISEATRANILRIVQEMNYAPPSRSCTDSRAVVLIPGAGLRMPPPALLQGIADFAAQQRAQLHILTLQQLMEDFPAKLTGCMLLVTFDELDRSKLDLIASASPDILVLDGNFSRKPFFNVRWDYAAAAYRLVCWLTQLGHRNFVYINEDFSPRQEPNRLQRLPAADFADAPAAQPGADRHGRGQRPARLVAPARDRAEE